MKRCLQNLSSEGRNLIIRNCTLNKDGKEELARSLGLTVNALRRRVFRIRTELHACCEKCVKKA
ncbi:MAG TPA: hypothetical protein VJ302_28495 [Blastocatellia bacterium]|nr:hypothetical protein [Blastocatellia bacterium]